MTRGVRLSKIWNENRGEFDYYLIITLVGVDFSTLCTGQDAAFSLMEKILKELGLKPERV